MLFCVVVIVGAVVAVLFDWSKAIWFNVFRLLTSVARLIAFCPLMIVVDVGLLLFEKRRRFTVMVRCDWGSDLIELLFIMKTAGCWSDESGAAAWTGWVVVIERIFCRAASPIRMGLRALLLSVDELLTAGMIIAPAGVLANDEAVKIRDDVVAERSIPVSLVEK
jgi:hypothetical protein